MKTYFDLVIRILFNTKNITIYFIHSKKINKSHDCFVFIYSSLFGGGHVLFMLFLFVCAHIVVSNTSRPYV